MEFIFRRTPPIILVFALFFLLFSPVFPTRDFKIFQQDNQTFEPDNESKYKKLMKAHITKINKPLVKSIQSPDGDIIDCVYIHLQPAFDHPKLKGTMPSGPPEIQHMMKKATKESVLKQLWSSQGESCPNGTIPIKRSTTSEDDIFKPIPISKFGKIVNADSTHTHQEHAIGYVKGDKYYGAQGTLNLWNPSVAYQNEFSSSQFWVSTDIPNHDFNTVEAGWTVSPGLYKDNSTRLFIYWTNDGYRSGCFNLLCPGFVQTNSKVALGTALSPVSIFDGEQYSMDVLIWKDTKNTQNWWLKVGNELMGYWPAMLFPDLQDHATLVEFGGLVFNSQQSGQHTSTQMGSGHLMFGGFKEAAYIKNLVVVDGGNNIKPMSGIQVLADRPSCYDVRSGFAEEWQNFIYFGGPGKNPNCP